jgi:hypothetical protein
MREAKMNRRMRRFGTMVLLALAGWPQGPAAAQGPGQQGQGQGQGQQGQQAPGQSSTPAQGQNPATARPDSLVIDSIRPPRAAMGDRISIFTASALPADPGGQVRKLVLFLDGRPMPGVHARPVGRTGREWEVQLLRADSSRDAWVPVLGSPDGLMARPRVGLGPENGTELTVARDGVDRLELVVVNRIRLILWLVLLAAALIGCVWLSRHRGLLRDSVPADLPPEQRPYSLARFQMAFWFFLVTAVFVGVWLVTTDHRGIVTAEALVLLGIAAGTAAGARSIEAGKADAWAAQTARRAEAETRVAMLPAAGPAADTDRVADSTALVALRTERADAEARLAALKAVPAAPVSPASEGFLNDILKDADGTAFHRFQALAWTLVLGIVFLAGAWRTLSMPAFDTTLLALLGISGGTYLGFKLSEPHT